MAISSNTYLLLNGNYHSRSSTMFHISNRAFAFGDSVVEYVHTCADRLCFIDRHLQHLRDAMAAAAMDIPRKFYNREGEFATEISKLITKNRIFYGSLVTIVVFRSKFIPLTTKPDVIEYVIYCEPLDELGYRLNDIGLRLGLIDGMAFSASLMSNFFTHDNSIDRLVIYKKCLAANIDDALIVNTEGHIVETAGNGNIFFVKGNTLFTPPLASGCKDDVIRRIILEVVAPEMGLMPVCDRPLHINDLKHIDEMFTASTLYGIQWVAAYKTQRFMRAKTTAIINKISELYKAQQ